LYVAIATPVDIERLYKKALGIKHSLEDWLAFYLPKAHKGSDRYLPVDSSGSHCTMHYLWMHKDEISKDELYQFTTGSDT
jgi:hypothetical protein